MEKETVFFSENVPLLATLGYPDSGEAPFPGIVLMHGHARHRNDGLDALSRRLNEAGYVTLRFDFRGCGETMYERYNIMCNTHCPEDAYNAVSFLMAQPEVDRERIGITGESLGGCTTVYAAANDDRIKCAVAMAAAGNMLRNMRRQISEKQINEMLKLVDEDHYTRVVTGHSRWLLSSALGRDPQLALEFVKENTLDPVWGSANSNYMTVAGFESLIKYNPEDVCERITIPILFLHGSEDELIDRSEGMRMCEKVSSEIKEFRIMGGLDHNMPINPKRDIVFDNVVDWFDLYL